MFDSAKDDDMSEINHSSEKGFKIFSLARTYPYIHFKEESNQGNAVLYYTTINGHLEVFKLFFGQFAKKLKAEQKFECLTSKGALGRTFLHSAANEGSLEVIKLILDEKGCPLLTGSKLFDLVTFKDDLGCSALQLAVQNNHYDVVNYLLDFGRDKLSSSQQLSYIALANQEGRTALHLAVINGHFGIVQLLIKAAKLIGPSALKFLKLKDNVGLTAVLLAYLKKHHQIYDFFLNEGEYVLSETEMKLKYTLETSSLCISKEEDFEYIKLCLDCRGGILSVKQRRDALMATDANQRSVFHLTAHYKHLETLKYLLTDTTLSAKELKEVLMLQDGHKFTAFHSAVRKAEWTLTKLLFEKMRTLLSSEELKNFFGLRNRLGDTVLHTAVKRGNYSTVYYFLTEEISEMQEIFFVEDLKSNTGFHLAANESRHDIMKLLLQFGKTSLSPAQLSSLLLAKNQRNETALQLAVIKGHLGIVKLVFGEDVLSRDQRTLLTTTDCFNGTVFHSATLYGHQEVLKYLLSRSNVLPIIDRMKLLMSQNDKGVSASEIAKRKGPFDVGNILLRKCKELEVAIFAAKYAYNNIRKDMNRF